VGLSIKDHAGRTGVDHAPDTCLLTGLQYIFSALYIGRIVGGARPPNTGLSGYMKDGIHARTGALQKITICQIPTQKLDP
jgi:hypothetical protein